MWILSSLKVAKPIESYPLYSNFEIQSNKIGATFLSSFNIHPTIPHIKITFDNHKCPYTY